MNYTPEEELIVNRMLAAKNYYEILGVPNNATSAAIAKAHNDLALQVNPQINKFPKAKMAFDALEKAAGILLNEDTRRQYDESLSPQDGTDVVPPIFLGIGVGLAVLFFINLARPN